MGEGGRGVEDAPLCEEAREGRPLDELDELDEYMMTYMMVVMKMDFYGWSKGRSYEAIW